MRNFKDKIAKKLGLKDYIGQEIYDVLNKEIEAVKPIVNEYIKDLSLGITNYINIFEPEAICLGGGFVHYKDILLPKLIDELSTNDMTYNKEIPQIVTAKMR